MNANDTDKSQLAGWALEKFKENKYDRLTEQFKNALLKIEDENLPATQKVLLQIVQCHRRTLNTPKRKWVIQELDTIQAQRNVAALALSSGGNTTGTTGIAFHKMRNRKLVTFMRALKAAQLEQACRLRERNSEIQRLTAVISRQEKTIADLQRRRRE